MNCSSRWRQRIFSEINLTSNDVILGIKDAAHPLPTYLEYGVPVTLATDDEGVSRIDLTHEYQRAVTTYDLNYQQLLYFARNSLQYSFLPGASLFSTTLSATVVDACAATSVGSREIDKGCADFATSPKTTLWELEPAQSFCRSLFPAVTTLRLDVLVQHLIQLRLVRLNLLWRKPLYRVRV